MIKRPLNPRFNAAVLEGRKITTIRRNAWPMDRPIMLYNWSGAAYRSPQIDVAPVMVEETTRIRIGRSDAGESIYYHRERWIVPGRMMWSTEGFLSAKDMDDWFRKTLKPGRWADLNLMRFRLVK